jgi:hypothetical protein
MPSSAANQLPPAYTPVPVVPGQDATPLRLCVVVRKTADPVAGHLVVLRDTIDARVLLGCVTDASGRVHQWVEVWIQTSDALNDTPEAYRQGLSNATLDDRWRRQCDAFDQLDSPGLIRTGWESAHPAPAFIDATKLAPVRLLASGNATWQICTDDALLARRGLPAYGTTLHRYLHNPAAPDGPLVALAPDAPQTDATVPLSQLLAEHALVPVNPGAGLIMVRQHHPISYEAFADVLGGAPWDGLLHGRTTIDLAPPISPRAGDAADNGNPIAEDRLFLARHGRAGHLVETLHLKLRLIADALAAARTLTAGTQRPILNLSADSFAVSVSPPAQGLPLLWTSRVHLNDPGEAVVLPIRNSDATYFVRGRSGAASVYRPASVDEPAAGFGALRVREVVDDTHGVVLIGTFTAQERIKAARSDLIWLRLNLGSGPVDVYAHLESERALAVGEWRIRSLPLKLPEQVVTALRAPQGYPFGKVHFDLVPLLSSPCDLYSLGVLAIRTLLVNRRNPMSFAWDEALSLASQVAAEHDARTPLVDRIAKVFAENPRWAASLGPQQLLENEADAQDAFNLIPPEIWHQTLAAVVRLFPGLGPDSFCRDYGDAPPNALHRVYDRPLEELNLLLVRTRSLILGDWHFNREVDHVIQKYLTVLRGEKPTQPRPAAATHAPAPTPAAAARPAGAAPAQPPAVPPPPASRVARPVPPRQPAPPPPAAPRKPGAP